MAKLGAAVSNSFQIGVAELRLGAMTNAGRLSQADSVGLIDEADVTVNQTKVELKGGFPKKLVASAITEQLATINATLREYSRKNLNIMLGAGIPAAITAVATTITENVAVSGTDQTLDVTSATGLVAGDVVVIYQAGKPETVSICTLGVVNDVDPDTIIIPANSIATAMAVADGVIHIYKANGIAIGNVTQVNYFSATLIQQGAAGNPLVWNFWKCAVGGNMDYKTSASDYASSKLELSILEPSLEDVSVTGALYTQASLIANHPMGMAVL